MELLELCTQCNYCQLEDKIYRQDVGVAMGYSLYPIFASIFMEKFEQKALVFSSAQTEDLVELGSTTYLFKWTISTNAVVEGHDRVRRISFPGPAKAEYGPDIRLGSLLGHWGCWFPTVADLLATSGFFPSFVLSGAFSTVSPMVDLAPSAKDLIKSLNTTVMTRFQFSWVRAQGGTANLRHSSHQRPERVQEQAIKKYIMVKYKVEAKQLAPFIRKYLKSAVASNALTQLKDKGAIGSLRLFVKIPTKELSPPAVNPSRRP
ncbi:hypothetical protein J6590_071850 [Homalodisca vitripennis]|nr:hypothetical protein J6590_071850 [Homalodisca vitripennis]